MKNGEFFMTCKCCNKKVTFLQEYLCSDCYNYITTYKKENLYSIGIAGKIKQLLSPDQVKKLQYKLCECEKRNIIVEYDGAIPETIAWMQAVLDCIKGEDYA